MPQDEFEFDFERAKKSLQEMGKGLGGRPPLGDLGGKLLKLVVVAVIALGASASFFTVEPEQEGIVLRFGKYVRSVDPGLNFKVPFMEAVIKVPVKRQLKEEFGFRTARADVRTEYQSGDFTAESLMLTGDLNAAEVEWVTQYTIVDPFKFLFKVRNPVDTFRDLNEAVMREVVGDRSVTEVLTIGRIEIENTASEKIQDLCNKYDLGINVDRVVLQDVNPPKEVKGSFNEVNQAQQEKETQINQAKAAYNKEIPEAKGRAKQTIEEAKGYAVERTNNAEGEVARFNAIYGEYRKAPAVTRTRIYLETMGQVLPRVKRKLIVDKDTVGLLPLYPFGDLSGPDAQGRK